jgi:hypothetical protein
VSWDSSEEKCHLQIPTDGVLESIGHFRDPVAAARFYDHVMLARRDGQEAELNFPACNATTGTNKGKRALDWYARIEAGTAKKGKKGKSPGVGAQTTVSPMTGVWADAPGPDPDKNAEPTPNAGATNPVAQGEFAGYGGNAWYITHRAKADASIAKAEEDDEEREAEEREEEERLPAVQRLIRGEWPRVVAAARKLKGLMEAIVAGAEGTKAKWTKPLRSMGKRTRKRLLWESLTGLDIRNTRCTRNRCGTTRNAKGTARTQQARMTCAAMPRTRHGIRSPRG